MLHDFCKKQIQSKFALMGSECSDNERNTLFIWRSVISDHIWNGLFICACVTLGTSGIGENDRRIRKVTYLEMMFCKEK